MQMLLSNLGITASQKRIARAAGVEKTIKNRGIRIDQMQLALDRLKANAVLWYKTPGTIDDIYKLNNLNYPVGVEWQGMFYEKEEEEEPGDYGHYAIISRVDNQKGELIIIDPYREFSKQDRIMAIDKFKNRWWDENEVKEKQTKKKKIVKDEQLLFVVTSKEDKKPEELGLKRAGLPGSLYDIA